MPNAILLEKVLTIKEDITAFGNRFWVQIEDSSGDLNFDLRNLVGKTFKAQVMLFTESTQDE